MSPHTTKTMQYQNRCPTHTINGVTSVDCQKQIWCWRFLRYLMQLIIPSCNQSCHPNEEEKDEGRHSFKSYYFPKTIFVPTSNIITGTFFGHRHGKLSFCIQPNPNTTAPILLLTLATPTTLLAKEMQTGLLRIALECLSDTAKHGHCSPSLLSMPLWTMYCNGRKVGFAIKRRPSKADMDVLGLMRSVSVGAGIISPEALKCDVELMYLRANFERVSGLSESESFHLINPDGSTGQELSIFFLRSP